MIEAKLAVDIITVVNAMHDSIFDARFSASVLS